MSQSSTPPLFPDAPAPAPRPSAAGDDDDTRTVARGMALLWVSRGRNVLVRVLAALQARQRNGRAFSQDDVRHAIADLRARGWVTEVPRREGVFQLDDRHRGVLYRELLDATPAPTLRAALDQVDPWPDRGQHSLWLPVDPAAAIARVRLELFSGAPAATFDRLRERMQRGLDWNEIVWTAVFPAFDAVLFERITPEWRWDLAFAAVAEMSNAWRADLLPVCEWAVGSLDTDRAAMPESLRLALAELLVHRGEPRVRERARCARRRRRRRTARVPAGAGGPLERGAGRLRRGDQAAAGRDRRAQAHATRRAWPGSIPLALLAQQTPKHLELARKFCIGEAGTRNPVAPRTLGPLGARDRRAPRRRGAGAAASRSRSAASAGVPDDRRAVAARCSRPGSGAMRSARRDRSPARSAMP